MRTGLAVVAFSALVLCAPFAAAQATFHVPADGTLQQGIDAIPDGGVIEVSAGTYVAPSVNGFRIVNKNKSFTIRGVGSVVLSGGGGFRVLELSNGRPVVFENLTFADGVSTLDGYAAGVTLHGAQATFVNCVFTNNSNNAPANGGGGSMVEVGSTAIFVRCAWTNNRAKNFGGAMSVGTSTVFIHDSEFVGNRTNLPGHSSNAAGGAIYMYNSGLRVTNSRFVNNEAGYVAGAIYSNGIWTGTPSIPAALVTIANSYFEGNKAKRDPGQASSLPTEAGAIHAENQCTVRVHNSRFVSNLADVGGALNTYRGEVEVFGSVFKGNTHPGTPGTGKFGGAVTGSSNDSVADGTNNRRNARIVIHDSFFQGRVSGQTAFPEAGGCVSVGGDQVRLYGLFGVPPMGGVVENRATADIQRSVFYDCDVTGNGIGGGISTSLTALTLADSIVMRSDGVFGGGLAALLQSAVTLSGDTFSDNASAWGGGVFAQGSAIGLFSCRIVRNSASASGSAIHSEPSSDAPVYGVVFGNTIAENSGPNPISESDLNHAVRYNGVQYDTNVIHPTGNVYFNPLVGSQTAAQLNSLVIGRSGGPTTDKSPSSNNVAASSAPVVGQILAVAPSLLGRGARNEAGPFPSYVGYAWGGAATATVNGVSKSGSGFVTVTSPGLQTLQVSSSSFSDVVATATMPVLGLSANPGTVRPGNSSTLSWGAVAGSVFEVAIDHGVGVTSAASGSALVVPPDTTRYRAVTVTAEGGADAEATVVVGIPPLVVSPAKLPAGTVGVPYSLAFTQTGGVPPITWSVSGALPSGVGLNPSSGVLSGTPGQAGSFWITVTATDSLGAQGATSGALAISRVAPFVAAALAVDGGGNSVFEAGESVVVAPSWRNATGGAQAVTGSAAGFTGPGDPVPAYTISDATASYGTVANGATASCSSTGNCFQLALSVPPTRPTQHWDARFLETLSSGDAKHWILHVGDTFADVPRSNVYYRFVETLLHRNITSGCSVISYCPDNATTRAQMAVFALLAKEGEGYAPPACGTPLFADVPAGNPFCRWIEELARRGVVSGCGGGNYCPDNPVSREQMAVFMLRTLDPAIDPPACGAPVFPDVPASSVYCRWIEELARRGVVSGCGGGNYCPASPVTRGQMGVFITATFGLTLYGS